jgi:hypothetical protein
MTSLQEKLIDAITSNIRNNLNITLTREDVLVVEAKTTIEDVMNMSKNLIRPIVPQLTEKQFEEIYKAVCFTQDPERLKIKYGEDMYQEFFRNRQKYISDNRHLIGKILTEVQKELSQQITD